MNNSEYTRERAWRLQQWALAHTKQLSTSFSLSTSQVYPQKKTDITQVKLENL